MRDDQFCGHASGVAPSSRNAENSAKLAPLPFQVALSGLGTPCSIFTAFSKSIDRASLLARSGCERHAGCLTIFEVIKFCEEYACFDANKAWFPLFQPDKGGGMRRPKGFLKRPHANGSVSDPLKSGNTSDSRAEKRATLCLTEAS
jgi:hypothetical protein